jgi:hypothetical protein
MGIDPTLRLTGQGFTGWVKPTANLRREKMTYIFHREAGWYQIDLNDDEQAKCNAAINPGTIKVTQGGRVVWMRQ